MCAQKEWDMAVQEGREDVDTIISARLTEFENWWRLEGKKNKLAGGAKAAAARGYSRLGTYTEVPAFMSRQDSGLPATGLPGIDGHPTTINPATAGNPLTGFSQLGLRGSSITISRQVADAQASRIANNRLRFGKDSEAGVPELDAKRNAQPQTTRGKGRQQSIVLKNAVAAIPENQKVGFFQDTGKERKPRRDKTRKTGGGTGFDAV
jgi:hypothetical protein